MVRGGSLVREGPATKSDGSEATRDVQQATDDDRTAVTRVMGKSGVKTAAVRANKAPAPDKIEGGEIAHVVRETQKAAAVRDAERAARYVETVKPAMPAVRFVCEERERELEDVRDQGDDGDQCHDEEKLRSGEGATAAVESARETVTMSGVNGGGFAPLPAVLMSKCNVKKSATRTQWGSESELGPSDGDDLHKDKYTKGSNKVTVTPRDEATRSDSEESKSDDNEVSGGVIDDDVAQLRLSRQRAHKQAKRQRVTVALAWPQRVKLEDAAEEQRDELWTARRRVAEEGLTQLEGKRQQNEAKRDEAYHTRAARVSLVHRSSTAARGEAIEYVGADNGLPTAMVQVAGTSRSVKLDSGALFTVAGTDWMHYGDKVEQAAPMEYVEDIGGFLLDVVGVWRFEIRSLFDQVIVVEACIVSGCTDEFLIGVDFRRTHRATMDFGRSEVMYNDAGRSVVIPFRTYDGAGHGRVAVVRTYPIRT
ncbi:unnamed protein product [Phytophthora fragariaefolia]|uniref:Unnamed protein product n=1 Tax=Phytophthora fragariaefolia TaxID=1490495 RepID=A0A9W7D5J8_9STRA|nr:unnamed protein product [Phytophthora fragariaefolia]